MKNPLWKIIAILAFTLILISIYALTDFRLYIGDLEIKESGVDDFFIEKDTTKAIQKLNQLAESDTVLIETLVQQTSDGIYDTVIKRDTMSKAEAMQRMDTTSQRILLIGDSMLEGLRLRLRDYVAYNNHEIKTVIWYSSTTKYYGESDTLAYYIRQYKPTYIILVLGANELFVSNIKERRQKYVDHILQQIGNRKFVWVGPPNWDDDTGINELIVENVGQQRYFPSKDLTYQRYSDNAHPTHASSRRWMDKVAEWIMNDSMYPIKMEKPPKRYKKAPTNTTLLQPLHN